jgi:transcriptional regulator NrdR family protein
MSKIIKRNGNIVEFDRDKIVNAINKAFVDVDTKLYETDTASDIAIEIEERIIANEAPVTVEEI